MNAAAGCFSSMLSSESSNNAKYYEIVRTNLLIAACPLRKVQVANCRVGQATVGKGSEFRTIRAVCDTAIHVRAYFL